jgi:TRAP-type transport system small permease protein
MRVYGRFLDGVEWVQRWVIVVAFVVMIAAVSFQVFNRYWLQLPVIWTAELGTTCFVWLAFLTASIAIRRNGHFRMAALIDLSGTGRVRLAFELLALAVVLLISWLLLKEGWTFAQRGLRETSPGLRIPMMWVYIAIPLTAATGILFAIERLMIELRGGPGSCRNPTPPTEIKVQPREDAA